MKQHFTVLFALLGILAIGCSLPSDESLIRRFQVSHADFQQLQRMVDEDNLDGRIHADYADPHLPDARLAEYRKLMRSAGIMRLWAHGKAKPLELVVDATGWLSHGDYKGYAPLLLAFSSSRDTALATSVTPKTTSDMLDPGSVPQ